MKTPLVSALIAVYNGEPTIAKALDSIKNQSYKNIEIVCVEDGSNDHTLHILKKWQSDHPEIKMTIIENKENIGLAKSLNKGIKKTKGKYIARIDADDTWTQDKTKKQMEFLLKNPNHGVIGSFYINKKNKSKKLIRLPVTNEKIKEGMFRKNPFGHSCIIIKKDTIVGVNGYNGDLREDRDLWFRLLNKTKFHNIPEFLVARDIGTSHFVSPKELRRNIKTVHTYIQHYKASPLNYAWLLEPIAVYIYHSFKKHVS